MSTPIAGVDAFTTSAGSARKPCNWEERWRRTGDHLFDVVLIESQLNCKNTSILRPICILSNHSAKRCHSRATLGRFTTKFSSFESLFGGHRASKRV
jgi:hypothetical protein